MLFPLKLKGHFLVKFRKCQKAVSFLPHGAKALLELLQPLQWCCVDCVIHHEWHVREEQHHTYMWREQAIIEWSWHVISIVACWHSAKLCAYAARNIRSQQNYFAFNQPYLAKGKIAPVVVLPLEAKYKYTILYWRIRTGTNWWFSIILRIRTGSDSILSDQDWTRTEKFHSPLIPGAWLVWQWYLWSYKHTLTSHK